MSTLKFLLLFNVVFFSAACGSLEKDFCELGLECDEADGVLYDPIIGGSEDSVDVCIINQRTFDDAFRINSEDICQRIADARVAYIECAVAVGCEAFNINEDECKDEIESLNELRDEAANRCNE